MKIQSALVVVTALVAGAIAGAATLSASEAEQEVWCALEDDSKCWSDCNGNPGTACYMKDAKNSSPPD